jgi:hypothetical protein
MWMTWMYNSFIRAVKGQTMALRSLGAELVKSTSVLVSRCIQSEFHHFLLHFAGRTVAYSLVLRISFCEAIFQLIKKQNFSLCVEAPSILYHLRFPSG